jgi:flagellar biosynthesis GTPase FlhF
MSDEQPRTDATSRERSPDYQYTLTIEQTAELYAAAGLSRSIRAIQKYCALSKLDCHKVETETGEKYLVAPYSVERHIDYINEVRTVATRRDQSRTDASVRTIEHNDEQLSPVPANRDEQPRQVANVRTTEAAVATALERENESLRNERNFLRSEIVVKNDQIKDLTERARETNHLIAGLQKMLSPLLGAASPRRDEFPHDESRP